MPHIFDNIDLHLLPSLQSALGVAYRADFCVGYFNLRGWRHLGPHIAQWPGGEGRCVRQVAAQIRARQVVVKLHSQV